MTTRPETRSMFSYAAACLRIYLEVHYRGLRKPLLGVQATLCEDSQTVMIEVPDGDDPIMASFKLPSKIYEASFDPRPYLEGFENAE
jgi:hypothetical protein